MKRRIYILKVALGICVTILSLGLFLTLKADHSTYPNHIYIFLIITTIIAGLGTLILSIVLAIINPQDNPIKVKTFRFNAIDKNGTEIKALAVLELLEQPNSKLRIDLNDQSYSAISSNAFTAMNKIRETTDELGIRFLIQGARPNCWPSRMSAQMSNGTMCYLLEMKPKQYRKSDLVGTFNTANKNEVGTLNEQLIFQKEWLKMLKESH
ncbi:MAG: hypothetical protein ACFHWX_06490 [Bacteroidota bacterium]